jgi:hypothetical protein
MAKNPSPLKGLLAASFKSVPLVIPTSELANVPPVASPVEISYPTPEPEPVVEVVAEEKVSLVPSEVIQEETSEPTIEGTVSVSEERNPTPPAKSSKPKGDGTRAPRTTKAASVVEDPLPPLEFDGVKKTTVSFYAAEQAQVDRILDTLLRVRRHRGGFSDAIKIALRLCPIDPAAIAKAWDEARAADRRTTRK